MAIRVADRADLAAIALLRADWTDGATPDPAFEERLARWWDRGAAHRTTWIAEADGAPVGMASLVEHERMPRPGRPDAAWGYVSTLYVREASRGRGIGGALLGALVAEAEARGHVRLVVHPSDRAVPLYERAGFRRADGSGGALVLLARLGGG